MSDETYEGWKNRETWAFWLHVTNDQGWHDSAREFVQGTEWSEGISDYEIGERVVEYVHDTLHDFMTPGVSDQSLEGLKVMLEDIGSWWRINGSEIGAAARELASDS